MKRNFFAKGFLGVGPFAKVLRKFFLSECARTFGILKNSLIRYGDPFRLRTVGQR